MNDCINAAYCASDQLVALKLICMNKVFLSFLSQVMQVGWPIKDSNVMISKPFSSSFGTVVSC